VSKVLRELGHEGEILKEFADRLHRSSLPSVDAFLERNPEYCELGKAAMAALLIPHEDFKDLTAQRDDSRWYKYLWQHLAQNLREVLRRNLLSVVTLNYDRSIEYSLFDAMLNTYGQGEQYAVDLFKQVPIIHVYGQLGELHFLGPPEGRNYTPGMNKTIVEKCASQIKIMEEAGPEWNRAHVWIGQAEVLCFLGFGYHELNVQRLRINECFTGKLYGSCFGMESDEIRHARDLFSRELWVEDFNTPDHFGKPDEHALVFLRRYPVFN
jgi:hypothetical protein